MRESVRKACEDDYERLKLLGEGSFAEVHLVRQKETGRLFALKVIDKAFIRRQGREHSVFQEKLILRALSSRHTTRLIATFQTVRALNFVLEYAPNGSLAQLLTRRGRLSLDETRFCAASIALVLEHIHGWGVVHRDLKPENLLLDADGRLKLVDFGAAEVLPLGDANASLFADYAAVRQRAGLPLRGPAPGDDEPGKSLVGTAYYIAPEMLGESDVDAACDLWAMGVLLHRLAAGRYLFDGPTDFLIFESIKRCEYTLAPGLHPQLADLIAGLVRLDPRRRLDMAAVKAHPFFAGVDFERLLDGPSPLAAGAGEPAGEPFRGRVRRTRLRFFYEEVELRLYPDGRVECGALSNGRVRLRLQLDRSAEVHSESAEAFRLCARGRQAVFYAQAEETRVWVMRFRDVIARL